MADGKLCNTCRYQQTTHDNFWDDFLKEARIDKLELPKGIGRWGKVKIRKYIQSLGVDPKNLDSRIFDILRCPGFSTTRKPRKKWRSFA